MNIFDFNLSEFREWIELILACIGGVIALVTYRQSVKQQRIENAMKITQWFHSSNDKKALDDWFDLLRRSCESAGVKRGYYIEDDGELSLLENYFEVTSRDGGSINKMADSFEVICYEIDKNTIDARFVWFELGQLLGQVFSWLKEIKTTDGEPYLIYYPSISRVFKKYEKQFNQWPTRTYFRFDP